MNLTPGAGPLLASSLVARLPLAMFSVELLVHAQALTGSFAVAGLVTGAYAISGAVSAPFVGRLVDHRGQTGVLVTGSALTAVLLLCIGLLPAGIAPAVLVVLAAAAGAVTPPLPACVRTLLPSLVASAADLDALFAFESTALELTFVIGPPLALGIGATVSTGAALIASGGVVLAGALMFALHPVSRSWKPEQGAERPAGGALRSGAIRILVMIDLATGMTFGATEVGVTAAAKHLSSAAAAAPLLGLWGVGSLIGGLIATRRGGSARTVEGLVALLAALAVLHGALLAGVGNLVAIGVIITLAGATIAPVGASIYAFVDRTAPRGSATEAYSWLFTAGKTGAAAGMALAGVLVQSSGGAAAFALAGVAGAAGVVAAIALRGRLQDCERGPVSELSGAASA
jgi:predicted MFS family arabinose efflux permease